MANTWKGLDLKVQTADLIGQDRRGTRRDDGFHRGYRREITESLERINRMMRESLDRLTRAGI